MFMEADFAVSVDRQFDPEVIEKELAAAERQAWDFGWRDRNGIMSESERRDIKFLVDTNKLFSRIVRALIDAENAEDKALAAGRHSLKLAMQTFCANAPFQALADERWQRRSRLIVAGFGWEEF
jgi:hypothetical protein